MCGILGVISDNEVNSINFAEGLKLLANRGPDCNGTKSFRDGRVLLGHTRLSIIDVSESGRQPLCNEDETLWLTFNGEIYNYIELRELLKRLGHVFKTNTDSEVILHSYEEWGVDCTRMLRGIYAFAIYSVIEESIIVLRDEYGVKPLYFINEPGIFAFSSTSVSLLAAVGKPRRISENSLVAYLTFGNLPGQLSIYQNVQKVPPGHGIIIKNNQFIMQPLVYPIYKNNNIKNCNNIDSLRNLVCDALNLNLRSDVPIAYFLSGGIDSTILCAIAQQNSDTRLDTFSLGFDFKESDETEFAIQASNSIGTNHHVAKIDYKTAISHLWQVAISFDEPFQLNSLIPYSYLCKFVKDSGFKVAIGGDGADELFGGYLWHSTWWESYDKNNFLMRLFLKNRSCNNEQINKYLQLFLPSSGGISQNLLEKVLGDGIPNHLAINCDLTGVNYKLLPLIIDRACFCPDHCLMKVDRSSMNYGLEVRVPYLDPYVSSFVKTLSPYDLLPTNERKWLLKQAFSKELAGINHHRKKGFSSPLHRWWEMGLNRIAYDALKNSQLFHTYPFLQALTDYSKEQKDIRSLTTLFSLALWSDCWLEDRRYSDQDLLVKLSQTAT
jgi:asparagine synthase (glutamine-hydrolysing)